MINAAERLSKRVRTAMGDHNNDDLPVTQCVINMRKEVVSLQAENEALLAREAGLVEALRMLVALGDQLNDNAIECVFDDSTVEVSSVVYWREFRLALEEADNALAAYRKQGGEA